jgi:hypothetical protein
MLFQGIAVKEHRVCCVCPGRCRECAAPAKRSSRARSPARIPTKGSTSEDDQIATGLPIPSFLWTRDKPVIFDALEKQCEQNPRD